MALDDGRLSDAVCAGEPVGLKVARLAQPWKRTAVYVRYLVAQASKTQRMGDHIAGGRVAGLARLLTEARPERGRVLCVGCRNRHELDVLHAAGWTPVGIDLLADGSGILAMDMHRLRFPDQSFDAIFACHSLEHAYDVLTVLREWARVTRPGGVWAVEVPIRYQVGETDRHDFGSGEGLREACAPFLSEAQTSESPNGRAARLVGRVRG